MNEIKTSLEHAKAAQGSFLHVHGMDNRHMYSNATILMNLRHIVENSQRPASAYFWKCLTRHR